MHALFSSLLTEPWEQEVLELFLENQYTRYLSHGLPQPFLDEMRGLETAAAALVGEKLSHVFRYAITIASIATGDVGDDLLYLLLEEVKHLRPVGRMLLQQGITPQQAADRLSSSALLKRARTHFLFIFKKNGA